MNRLHMHARTGRRSIAGLSIVELMVAVAIGLFLLSGFSASFVSLKRSFSVQDRLTQLQDDERLVLGLLASTVRAAGYYPDPVNTDAQSALPTADTAFGSLAAGQGLVGTGGATADSLTTRYVMPPGSALTDCLGQPNQTAAARTAVNLYWIAADHTLRCSLDGGATSVVLVDGVQSMSLLYGVAGADNAVNRYMTGDEVNAAGSWTSVRSARVTVSFVNPYAGQPGEAATIDWVQTINLMNRT
jgi:type IV pilus assembly protein PilW